MRSGPAGQPGDALFSSFDFHGGRKVVVAVSGGGDSLALLMLLNDFPGPAALVAVTVDHGLRPAAAAEARSVAALCRTLGVEHRTMVWTGEKPSSGLIAAAREARYALLARAADEAGAQIVVTAHTMDDQAETVAMRQKRGSGTGLAGMAGATLYDGRIWIARPLLGLRRQALRDLLRARGVAWTDDPTNDDPAYERVRMRAALADGEVERLSALAAAAGEARAALSARAAGLIARFVTKPAPGLFRLDPAMLRQEDDAVLAALRMLAATAGGTAHPPDIGRTRILAERLRAGRLRATLSRAVIDARASAIWMMREGRDLPSRPLETGASLWDGRWRIETGAVALGLVVAPSGPAMEAAADRDVPQSLVRAAISREPGLYRDGVFIAAAGSDEAAALGVRAHPAVAPYARFLPGFDLALADALARIAGTPPMPVAPWNNHIERSPLPRDASALGKG